MKNVQETVFEIIKFSRQAGLRHISKPQIREELKKTYKIFFRSRLNTTQALDRLQKEKNLTDEVKYFINFVKETERGICKEWIR